MSHDEFLDIIRFCEFLLAVGALAALIAVVNHWLEK